MKKFKEKVEDIFFDHVSDNGIRRRDGFSVIAISILTVIAFFVAFTIFALC